MTSTFERKDKQTLEITMTIPWSEITKTYEKVIESIVASSELSGFRKGKAPRAMVEKTLDKGKVYEQVIKEIIPSVYGDAVKQHNLHPVVVPKIELTQAEEGKDWVIKAHTCERPVVELGDYKKKIQEMKAGKHQKIWTPQDGAKEDKKEEPEKVTLDEILETLFSAIQVTISDLLLENEVNRLLSELIDQTKKLGLTVEQYLAATHKTVETVQEDYKQQAERTIALEFALEDIADKEGILISDDDIDTVIKSAKSEEEKQALTKERYYLASILRRQKTIDFLSAL